MGHACTLSSCLSCGSRHAYSSQTDAWPFECSDRQPSCSIRWSTHWVVQQIQAKVWSGWRGVGSFVKFVNIKFCRRVSAASQSNALVYRDGNRSNSTNRNSSNFEKCLSKQLQPLSLRTLPSQTPPPRHPLNRKSNKMFHSRPSLLLRPSPSRKLSQSNKFMALKRNVDLPSLCRKWKPRKSPIPLLDVKKKQTLLSRSLQQKVTRSGVILTLPGWRTDQDGREWNLPQERRGLFHGSRW